MPEKSTTQIIYEQEQKDVDKAIETINRITSERYVISERIRNIIISIDEPFTKIDIIYILMFQYGIDNLRLINSVLDDLCESGILRHIEIEENRWAFVKES